MRFDYARSQITAARLIERFGREVVLVKPGVASGPAYDPTFGPGTQYAVRAVDLRQRRLDAPGTLAMQEVRTLYISSSIEISKADEIVIDGEPHAIVEVRPLEPGGVVIFYEVDLQ